MTDLLPVACCLATLPPLSIYIGSGLVPFYASYAIRVAMSHWILHHPCRQIPLHPTASHRILLDSTWIPLDPTGSHLDPTWIPPRSNATRQVSRDPCRCHRRAFEGACARRGESHSGSKLESNWPPASSSPHRTTPSPSRADPGSIPIPDPHLGSDPGSLIPDPPSWIPHPQPQILIPDPPSRIPHPGSPIPDPPSRIPHPGSQS